MLLTCQLTATGFLPSFQINGMTFGQVEVAATEAERERGLMNRDYLPEGAGMIFIFDKPGLHCFWMSNTLVPLDVIFLDAEGTVVSVATMVTEPPRKSDESVSAYEARLPLYCSKGLCSSALEVPAGTAKMIGLKTGDTIPELSTAKLLKP